jgi:hypothetical protein
MTDTTKQKRYKKRGDGVCVHMDDGGEGKGLLRAFFERSWVEILNTQSTAIIPNLLLASQFLNIHSLPPNQQKPFVAAAGRQSPKKESPNGGGVGERYSCVLSLSITKNQNGG